MSAVAEVALLSRLDARLLTRHGVVAAVVVLTATWAGLLAALPEHLAADLVPPALYLDAAVVGLFFLGGAVLVERRQGSLEALAVSPLRPSAYVAGKVIDLTVLATAATLIIAAVAAPRFRPVELILAVVLVSPPILLIALAVAARADTIVGYLVRVQAPLTPAVLPLLASAGWLPEPLAWITPTMGPFRLLEAGTGGRALAGWEWTLAILVPLVTTSALWRLAAVRVRGDLLRSGRVS